MERKRPNILFLLTDQQRWDALGLRNAAIHTPNLDRLARSGILFSEAVCQAPMCVPSRYSIMTGLYPHQIGVRHNAQSIQDARTFPVPTVAEYLRKAGYHTIHSGKAHWFQRADEARGIPPSFSTDFGFDRRFVGKHANTIEAETGTVAWAVEDPEAFAAFRALDTRGSAPFQVGGEGPVGYAGGVYPLSRERMRESWFTSSAIDALNDAPEDRPWFLHLSLDAPHAPLFVPQEFIDLYDIDTLPDTPLPPPGTRLDQHASMPGNAALAAETWEALSPRERRRHTLHYYAFCSFMDAEIGRLLEAVERRGELADTFILFTSDHGESLGDRYRFSKYSFYESSVRVPLFVSGAGVPNSCSRLIDDRSAELVDVLPTLLEVAGLPMPPYLVGESLLSAGTRTGAYSEYHGIGCESRPVGPAYMWRTRDWKLITAFADKTHGISVGEDSLPGELYHLRADPHEWLNLYGDPAYSATLERLRADLRARTEKASESWSRLTEIVPLA